MPRGLRKPLALPAPKADPATVERVVKDALARATAADHGPMGWVGRLEAREAAGMKLTQAQRDMLRDAQGKA